MITITIANKTFNLPEQWSDIKLKTYLKYINLANSDVELDKFKLIEVLCGVEPDYLDDLTMDQFNQLSSQLAELTIKFPEISTVQSKPYFTIDGINYVTRKINTMNDLTLGEYVSIDIVRKNHIDDFIPYILAIIIRPGQLIIDEETKEERWEIEPFNKKDIKNLDYRANLFKEKVSTDDLIPTLNFFLNMKEELEMNIQ